MEFERIIVIGTKQLALECIKAVHNITTKIEAIVHIDNFDFCYSKKYLIVNKIPFKHIYDKDELNSNLAKIEEDCLIISANNVYIFPDDIVKKQNLTIINFHDALLPKHSGINAPTWSIYEGDKYTGISWHYVVKEIDCGPIIVQSKIPINIYETAYSLTKKTIELGIDSFKQIVCDLLSKRLVGWQQIVKIQDHFSWEIPNKGLICSSDSFEFISRFLRATDYPGLEKFENRKIKIKEKYYSIKKYRIEKTTIYIICCNDNNIEDTFEFTISN